MMKLLVQGLGMDIWTEGPFTYRSTMYGYGGLTVKDRVTEFHTFLPLHAAAL